MKLKFPDFTYAQVLLLLVAVGRTKHQSIAIGRCKWTRYSCVPLGAFCSFALDLSPLPPFSFTFNFSYRDSFVFVSNSTRQVLTTFFRTQSCVI